MGAQKNRLIETVLLSTHNICFGSEMKKIVFQYALLSGGLFYSATYKLDVLFMRHKQRVQTKTRCAQRLFRKVDLLKNQQTTKSMEKYPVGKVNTTCDCYTHKISRFSRLNNTRCNNKQSRL